MEPQLKNSIALNPKVLELENSWGKNTKVPQD
jgi:hypothetical protein